MSKPRKIPIWAIEVSREQLPASMSMAARRARGLRGEGQSAPGPPRPSFGRRNRAAWASD